MDREAILKAYRRYTRNYDLYFGALFQPGRSPCWRTLKKIPGADHPFLEDATVDNPGMTGRTSASTAIRVPARLGRQCVSLPAPRP
jgi:hypothetical protein